MILTDVHRRMLEAGEFHVDGWTTQRGRNAAAELERAGYVTSFESHSDQYTAINYQVTERGRKALRFQSGK